MNFAETSRHLGVVLKKRIPRTFWDGRESIMEMKEGGSRNWKQMEWIGFYFEFICTKCFGDIMEIPGPKYGNMTFDGYLEIPWDFKAHVISGGRNKIIVNDRESTLVAIKEYGCVGLIIAFGEAEYNDQDGTFREWHSKIKGGRSAYVERRIDRGAPPRIRKVSFRLEKIMFIRVTDEIVSQGGPFQEGFRNADGSPRRSKFLIDYKKLDQTEHCHIVDFDNS